MSFNTKNYYELKEAFEKKHLDKIAEAESRAAMLAARVEGVGEIDAALSTTASRIFQAALAGKAALAEQMDVIKRDTAYLREARARLLEKAGYIKANLPHVSLTDSGMLISNSIITELLENEDF